MKISDAFPSRYISAADLQKIKSDDRKFVIKELKFEDCINPRTKKKEAKLVVYFQGASKAHRLRKSESAALITAFGDDDKGWLGKTVTLRCVQTPTGAGVRMIPVTKPGEDLGIDENQIPEA
jgi:hypothetical protein